MTAPAPTCSKGWAARCTHGRGRRCACHCRGANHGRENPDSLVHHLTAARRKQLELFTAPPVEPIRPADSPPPPEL